MPNSDHIKILQKGVEYWNKWRMDNPAIKPDFFGASFEAWRFYDANFEGVNFREADLSRAQILHCNMRGCNCRKTYFAYTDLSHSKIIDANLNRATFVNTTLFGTTIENCVVYGTSAWNLKTDINTIQKNLILEDIVSLDDTIRMKNLYPLMVDDLEVAQFIHLITNTNLGKSLNTIMDKGVLLLGEFKDGGIEFLKNNIADKVRERGLIPIIYDFTDSDGNISFEKVKLLAGISSFVIANLKGSSVPAELAIIISTFKRPMIIYTSSDEVINFSMFPHLFADDSDNFFYIKYSNLDDLYQQLGSKIIEVENKIKDSQKSLEKVQNMIRNA